MPGQVKELCPDTPEDLLFCVFCKVPATRGRIDKTFPWARVLYCMCKKDWVVCAHCSRSTSRMITQKAIYMHNRNCHDAKKRKIAPKEESQVDESHDAVPDAVPMIHDAVPMIHDDFAHVTGDCDEPMLEKWMEVRSSPGKQNQKDSLVCGSGVDDSRRNLFCPTASIRDFGNAHSSTFFNADINGTGVADVVALGQFGICDVGKELHPSDVQYATDMGNFVHGLSQIQRSDLSRLLHGTVLKVKRDMDPLNKRQWKTEIPANPSVMRKLFWEGKQSFLGNIPFPTVHLVENHAYVSLRDCIRNRLAFGFPLEKVEFRDNHSVHSVMQSESSQRVLRRCDKDYKEPVLIILLKEWQDGYDPHSFSKTNRGSSWIKIVTISEPHEHKNGPEVS